MHDYLDKNIDWQEGSSSRTPGTAQAPVSERSEHRIPSSLEEGREWLVHSS